MTRLDKLKQVFIPNKKINLFTEDCETITGIFIELNIIEYFVTVTASCGCCGEYEHRDYNLDEYLDLISEEDFNDLLKIYENNKI
jgi:hypothetical protein